jgi:hypothetical protein
MAKVTDRIRGAVAALAGRAEAPAEANPKAGVVGKHPPGVMGFGGVSLVGGDCKTTGV